MTLVYELSPYCFFLTRPAFHIYERFPHVENVGEEGQNGTVSTTRT
jgi:hypothetical protein